MKVVKFYTKWNQNCCGGKCQRKPNKYRKIGNLKFWFYDHIVKLFLFNSCIGNIIVKAINVFLCFIKHVFVSVFYTILNIFHQRSRIGVYPCIFPTPTTTSPHPTTSPMHQPMHGAACPSPNHWSDPTQHIKGTTWYCCYY